MWYFAQMNPGDIVVVPLYDGKFSVYEIVEIVETIDKLENIIPDFHGIWNKNRIIWNNHRLFDETENREIDIGFFIKVKPVVENVPRSFAEGKLISRMKIRTTSAEITDIKEYVDKAIQAGRNNRPITLYEEIIDSLVEKMQESIYNILV